MIIGIDIPMLIAPVDESACKIPTDADEDWITAVRSAPVRTPSKGLSNKVRIDANSGLLLRPDTADDIESIPYIRVAKPRRITPISFFLLLFEPINSTIPIRARIGVKDVGLNISTYHASPLTPVKLRSHAVTVVPTLAPIITLIACLNVRSPELTKPTTITVVADED
jgi:hypothetical protein